MAYVWFIRRHVTLHISDALYYHASANLLATGHGFILPFAPAGHAPVQAADHPPLYIVYLAAFSLVGVRSITGHLLASTLLGAASIVVAGFAGRDIVGPRTGLVAARAGGRLPEHLALRRHDAVGDDGHPRHAGGRLARLPVLGPTARVGG